MNLEILEAEETVSTRITEKTTSKYIITKLHKTKDGGNKKEKDILSIGI